MIVRALDNQEYEGTATAIIEQIQAQSTLVGAQSLPILEFIALLGSQHSDFTGINIVIDGPSVDSKAASLVNELIRIGQLRLCECE